MKGRRTGLEFESHQLFTVDVEGATSYILKKPGTEYDCLKFINTNGIMAVTGDYGNWIFCREFKPAHNAKVSDQYWIEKLTISSTQKPYEFSQDETRAEIEALLLEDDLTEEETEYLQCCLEKVDEGKFDYEFFAYRENVGRFQDYESVPLVEKPKHWLLVVFDAWEEVCRRTQPENNK